MLLTHCVMRWIVLTVISLCLPVWSAVKVIQPYSVISTNGTAQIQCFVLNHPSYHQDESSIDENLPDFGPENLHVTLLKGLHGTQELCSFTTKSTGQEETSEEKKEGKVQCSAQLTEGTVEVTVSGLKSTDTDLYRCEIEFFYPPPYLRLFGNGTLIHVLDSSSCPMSGAHSQTAHQRGEEEDVERDAELVSVPVVILVILIICVMVIIIYFQIHQCERGRREAVRPMPSVVHKVDAIAFSCDNTV